MKSLFDGGLGLRHLGNASAKLLLVPSSHLSAEVPSGLRKIHPLEKQ